MENEQTFAPGFPRLTGCPHRAPCNVMSSPVRNAAPAENLIRELQQGRKMQMVEALQAHSANTWKHKGLLGFRINTRLT